MSSFAFAVTKEVKMEEEKKKTTIMEEEERSVNIRHGGGVTLTRQHFLLFLSVVIFAIFAGAPVSAEFDYADALTKSLLYFESQRSGRLPYNQRATWRDHSGLTDGLEQGVSTLKQNYIKITISLSAIFAQVNYNYCFVISVSFAFSLSGRFGWGILRRRRPREIRFTDGVYGDNAVMECD